MLKKFSFTVLLVPLMVLLNGGMLVVEVIMLRAGTGSLDNADKHPSYPGWYTLMIDADDYKFSASDPYGLPDSHDFSKRKEFFAIYPSLYCSGQKSEKKGHDSYGNVAYNYEADYCSPWGYQFDLQWLWRVWGVDLIENNYIAQNPRMIWISLITGACATALSVLLKLVGFCFFYAKVASCIVTWVSMACLCATSATSQIWVGNMANGLPKLKVGGTGSISAQGGPYHTRAAWILTAVSCASALIETFILYRHYRLRRARSSSPSNRGRVAVVGGHGGVYQHLGPGGKEGLHGGSQIELIHSSSRAPSPMRGGDASYGGGKGVTVSVTTQESAYEPMRHREA
ncbi:hypothetical protein B0T16DRAFT_419817 [Cercophora newfieldiana]|uniref:Uncharacterized protein n=1 Tax=Cercophora newfieldiana TaxID=92897 RepID=A0AA39XW91_9PEZI|nr:hypothetical protein B0T16DRAFT_419817 [Cercophora newfieldiana]